MTGLIVQGASRLKTITRGNSRSVSNCVMGLINFDSTVHTMWAWHMIYQGVQHSSRRQILMNLVCLFFRTDTLQQWNNHWQEAFVENWFSAITLWILKKWQSQVNLYTKTYTYSCINLPMLSSTFQQYHLLSIGLSAQDSLIKDEWFICYSSTLTYLIPYIIL